MVAILRRGIHRGAPTIFLTCFSRDVSAQLSRLVERCFRNRTGIRGIAFALAFVSAGGFGWPFGWPSGCPVGWPLAELLSCSRPHAAADPAVNTAVRPAAESAAADGRR